MRRIGDWIGTAVWACVAVPAFFIVGFSGWTVVVLWHQAKQYYRDWREA